MSAHLSHPEAAAVLSVVAVVVGAVATLLWRRAASVAEFFTSMATPLAPARVRAKVYTAKNVRFAAITGAAFAVISAVIAVVQFIDFLTGQ